MQAMRRHARDIVVALVLAAACCYCAAAEEAPPAPGALPNVLTLEMAQRRALADNPSLQAFGARVAQAAERVRQVRSLYFPQLAASYNATHTELSDVTVNAARAAAAAQAGAGGAPGTSLPAIIGQSLSDAIRAEQARNAVPTTVDSYDLRLTASYLLFDGLARRYNYAAARFGEQETEEGQREAQRLILDAVARSFFGVQLARENTEIAAADESFNERLLREAKARHRVGTGSLSDKLNFEVQVRAARTAVLEGERERDIARIGLATLMGLPEGALPPGIEIAPLHIETPEDMQSPEQEACIAYALGHRPDVLQSQIAIERNNAGVGAARSFYYPKIAGFASYDGVRTGNSHFDDDDFSTTVGLSVTYDLFTGGRNRAALREAKYARDEAERINDDTEINAIGEVRQSLVNLATSQQELILQRDTTSYVEHNRDLVEKEYSAGQGSLARLNQAQRDLTAAQGRLALVRVALDLAWHNLRTATAETLAAYFPETAEVEEE